MLPSGEAIDLSMPRSSVFALSPDSTMGTVVHVSNIVINLCPPTRQSVCFGSSEKFGSWDAYTLFHAVGIDPMKPSGGLCSIERGDRVLICGQHLESDATVVRILRGQKQSGTAAAPKDQHVFYALLQVGSDWKYTALKHVSYFGGYKYYLCDCCK